MTAVVYAAESQTGQARPHDGFPLNLPCVHNKIITCAFTVKREPQRPADETSSFIHKRLDYSSFALPGQTFAHMHRQHVKPLIQPRAVQQNMQEQYDNESDRKHWV